MQTTKTFSIDGHRLIHFIAGGKWPVVGVSRAERCAECIKTGCVSATGGKTDRADELRSLNCELESEPLMYRTCWQAVCDKEF